MHPFNEILQIDKKFQKSINMRLDYNQKDKIKSYIPTRASVHILKTYLQEFVKEKGMKSTMLVGPYGKGKSHLLLILLALLSKRNQNSNIPEVRKIMEEVVQKIKKIDIEAGVAAAYLIEQKKSYLPVIVSGAQRDLSRAMLLSLREALVREGLENLVPDTYFEEAKKTITQWKDSYPDTYKNFVGYLKEKSFSELSFFKSLERYEKEALDFFKEIYPKLTAGSIFEPMVHMDLLTLFHTVNKSICKDYGYEGIVLIFDEFSKFVEGYPKESFSSAMEELQNICELANASKKEKLHVILVAHKPMKEYRNVLPKEVINAYLGVEGRISEIYFTTSLKNSYELIQNAIIKNNDLFQKVVVETEKFQDMQESSYQLPYFQALFGKKEFEEIVVKGCFPMTPVAAYLLLKISEKAVQNERTVFTFLSNDEPYSLIQFLEREKNFHGSYVTAGQIYDYFSNILKNDTSNEKLHNEWLKAEYALSGKCSLAEQDVLKTIALVRMVGKQDEMYAEDEVIRIGAGLNKSEYEKVIEGLKEQQILLFRSKTRAYAFKNNIGVDLEKEIKGVVDKKLSKINLCRELSRLSELKYEIPKRYNQKYAITRYFHYQFMMLENFLNLKSTEYLFQDKFADGKIIALIGEEEIKEQEAEYVEKISNHLKNLGDKRVVVVSPLECFKEEELVKRILAIEILKNSQEFLENNKALEQELEISLEDLTFELNATLEQYFLPYQGNSMVFWHDEIYGKDSFSQRKSDSKFNQFLSDILERYYCHSPKINNELINKRTLTAQISKARIKLIEQILAKEDFSSYNQGTSAEATIFRAVFQKTGVIPREDCKGQAMENEVSRMLRVIDEYIESAAGEKQKFSVLYQRLQGENFGMRAGILPLYIAFCISKWEDTPVISLGDKEVKLEAKTFENINESPENYSLYMEKETIEKENYLRGLEELFLNTNAREYKEKKFFRLQMISDGIYAWFCSLPQCARGYIPNGKKRRQEKGIQKFKSSFSKLERNAREVLMDNLLEAYEAENYSELLEEITSLKKELDHYILQLTEKTVEITRQVFELSDKEDLKQGLQSFFQNKSNRNIQYVYSRQTNELIGNILRLETHHEKEIVEIISKTVLDLFLEDWKEKSLEQYLEKLQNIRTEIEETSLQEREEESSRIVFTDSQGNEIERYYRMEEEDGSSEFLRNEIESALEDFGDCLETNQKISVMVRMIEKLLEEK